jgi:hypothetical protein
MGSRPIMLHKWILPAAARMIRAAEREVDELTRVPRSILNKSDEFQILFSGVNLAWTHTVWIHGRPSADGDREWGRIVDLGVQRRGWL